MFSTQFTYNGCSGNLNNFGTIEQCNNFCLSAACTPGDVAYVNPNTKVALPTPYPKVGICPLNPAPFSVAIRVQCRAEQQLPQQLCLHLRPFVHEQRLLRCHKHGFVQWICFISRGLFLMVLVLSVLISPWIFHLSLFLMAFSFPISPQAFVPRVKRPM